MERTATAIALAIVLVATSLSVAPAVTAAQGDCQKDFKIADSEALANDRTLLSDQEETGREDVTTGIDETLHVELLTTNDELTWTVFFKDANNDCVEYTQGGCDGPNVIDQQEEQTCTLESPEDRFYWVEFVNTGAGDDDLMYKTWVS